MKRWVDSLIMAAAVLIVTVIAFRCNAQFTDLYPMTATVTGFDLTSDSVIATDASGEMWCFSGIEDWHVGDVAAFIMDSCGTEAVFDDRIVSVRYSG